MTLESTQPLTVPGAFPGGKGGRCVRLTTLPPSYAVVMKSGNLLEPSGPLQACNGTVLPFTFYGRRQYARTLELRDILKYVVGTSNGLNWFNFRTQLTFYC